MAHDGITHRVGLEAGSRRVFAAALDWPGWCRSGRDEEGALATLAAAADRYAGALAATGLAGPRDAPFEVVERLRGNATTDFGAPGQIGDTDRTAVPSRERERLAAIVAASWAAFDRVAAAAPATLRKGPRGGGRDRDPIVDHVVSTDASYGRKIRVRLPAPPPHDPAAVAAHRAALLDVLVREDGPEHGWPVRYAARRIAWHALDHAWEIEDRGDG